MQRYYGWYASRTRGTRRRQGGPVSGAAEAGPVVEAVGWSPRAARAVGRVAPKQIPIRIRANDPNVVVVDARKAEEYPGTTAEEGVPRAGHIPGAKNLEWASLFERGKVRDKATLTNMIQGAGVTAGRTIVTYCRVGTRASALYLVARALSLPTKMFDGSMVEWSSRIDLPVATGPAAGSMP